MTTKLITVILLFSGLNLCLLLGQTSKKTNLEVLEQDISGELEKILFYPDVNRDIQFVFYVTSVSKDKNEKKFIESVIKKTADKNRLKISFSKDEQMLSTDSFYNKVNIGIIKLNTAYTKLVKNKFLGDKSIERVVSSELSIEISTNLEETKVKDKILTSYKGEIPYESYENFETGEYSFTQSIPPNISWFETIIFPAVIVTVSAAATILFFIIRSK